MTYCSTYRFFFLLHQVCCSCSLLQFSLHLLYSSELQNIFLRITTSLLIKGNQSWIFTGGINAEAEAPILWPPDAKSWLIRKDAHAGKIEGRKRRGQHRLRWLGGITNSMNKSLSKLRKTGGQGSLVTRLSDWTTSLLNSSSCSCVVFLISLDCLSLFYFISVWFLQQLFWILYQANCSSPFPWDCLLENYCFFGDVMFPQLVIFLVLLHSCLHIERSNHLLQFLLTSFGREIPLSTH